MKPRECPECGVVMHHSAFGAIAGNTFLTEFECPKCGQRYQYSAMIEMITDNKRILEMLDSIEDPKEGEIPWPEE